MGISAQSSPIRIGEIAIVLGLDFDLEQTGDPFSLVGATQVQLTFAPAPNSPAANVRFIGTGVLTITDAFDGQATYAPSTADLSKPGAWLVQAVATFPSGPRFSDPIEIVIEAPL